MATTRRDYVITVHVRERFVQRTNKKYMHMQQCRQAVCCLCDSFKACIKREAHENQQTINEDIYERLAEADEDRSYLNNSGFMGWYYNKYGYDKRFEFLVHGDLLFVVVYDEGKKVIVTCVAARTHLAGKNLIYKPRFNRVKTKEEKLLEI